MKLRDIILTENPIKDLGLEKILKSLKNNPEKRLRVLRLADTQLGSTAGIRLSHMLKEIEKRPVQLQIKALDISNNQIGNLGIKSLCSYLKTQSVLEYLDISENHIDSEGFAYVSEMLKHNSTLKVIHAMGNQGGYQILKQIANDMEANVRLKVVSLRMGTFDADDKTIIYLFKYGLKMATSIKNFELTLKTLPN